jgi:type I restriction enzyme S subunit
MSTEADTSSDHSSLAQLPPGWCWVTVEQIAEVQGGIQKQPKRVPGRNAYPFLRVANVLRDRLDLSDVHRIELFGDELARLRLEEGDLLIVEGNGSKSEIGRSALWRGEISDCVHQNHIIRIRPQTCPPSYFNAYLNSPEAIRRITEKAASTSGLYTLSVAKVSRLPVPIAPQAEQQRIVEKAGDLLSDLDAGVKSLVRARANLKKYRAAVLKAAVTGELTADWRATRPDTEPASKLLERILVERRRKWASDQQDKFETSKKTPPKNWEEKYPEPSPPDVSVLPQLPSGWCWTSVGQVSEFTRYGSSAKTNADSSGVPVARMGNIQVGKLVMGDVKYLPHQHTEFPELILESGDILFNRTNSAELVGKTAVYRGHPSPCSYASYLISVRLLPGCYPDLVAYFINSTLGRQWVKSVVNQQCGQANVNGTKLQSLAIPLPPLAEQQAIVDEVEWLFSIMTATEAYIAASLKRATRLRQSILKEAFAGRLVPQDPSDEPASALLERIRKTRQNENGSKNPSKLRRSRTRIDSGNKEVGNAN